MCGRFAQFSSTETIAEELHIDEIADFVPKPSYNIAPGQWVSAVVKRQHKKLGALRWGLLPSWAKDESIAHKLINARSETCHQKPSFRDAFKKKRCGIICNGYYEWQKTPEGKSPNYIYQSGENVPLMAGLFEMYTSPTGEKIPTCTILTISALDELSAIHDRMPVFLSPGIMDTWLSPGEISPDFFRAVLEEHKGLRFESYPVSKQVNSPSHNTPDCIKPL